MELMKCPNCGEDLENGAAFCGNCGQAIAPPPAGSSPTAPAQSQPQSSIPQVWAQQSAGVPPRTVYPGTLAVAGATGIPSYAVPVAGRQANEIRAGMAVVLGVVGIVIGLFIPLVGLGLGVVGLVLATVSRHAVRRRLSVTGIVVSILCILVAMASWAYVVARDPRFNHKAVASTGKDSSAVTAQNVITPCYVINFSAKLNVQNNSGSCNVNAFNGDTLDDSSDAYKVYGTASAITASGFESLAKQAIENDVHQSLPSFTVTHESAGQFVGSPAYFVTASNGAGVSVMEAAALHKTTSGNNFFVFVHAVNANTVDLSELQAGWHWE